MSISSCSIFTGSSWRRSLSSPVRRWTWVSTTIPSFFLNQVPRITFAVLRPTPGSAVSSSIVCGTSPPCRSTSACAIPMIDLVLLRKKPVDKTKSIIGMAQALVERHGGEVPQTMEELTALPGVGRKTANVILGTWFHKNEGVVVDTHVHRLSRLLGLTRQDDPVKIEQDLMQIVPRDDWTWFSHTLIQHGRNVCIARRPRCADCVLNRLCPSSLV